MGNISKDNGNSILYNNKRRNQITHFNYVQFYLCLTSDIVGKMYRLGAECFQLLGNINMESVKDTIQNKNTIVGFEEIDIHIRTYIMLITV